MISINNIKKYLENITSFNKKDNDFLAGIINAFLKAKELRISSIAREMKGHYESNYKSIQRFLDKIEFESLKEILSRFTPDDIPYIIVDPTEIERPSAKKTEYVGFLKRW